MADRTIGELAEGLLARMREIGYAESTTEGYRRVLGRYEALASSRGARRRSDALDADFVDGLAEGGAGDGAVKLARRACRLLARFEASGDVAGRARKEPVAPASSARLLELYLADCAGRGLSDATLRARQEDGCEFLWYVERAGREFPAGVDAALLDDWAEALHAARPGSVRRSLSSVRCMLEYLFTVGVTDSNLGAIVPRPTRYPKRPVSKVWTDEEVGSLISSIPDGTPIGKRDKAVCLLLATYGMRSGDVRRLTTSCLDFDASTIRFTQSKTGVENVLPMTDDVAWALADWLRNGRPEQATCAEVFTTLRPPYGPLSHTAVGAILEKRRDAAGIAADPSGPSGPHSLRHTSTTKMVTSGAPLPVVSSVLGHSMETTTMIYLHADLESLRRCALGEGVV